MAEPPASATANTPIAGAAADRHGELTYPVRGRLSRPLRQACGRPLGGQRAGRLHARPAAAALPGTGRAQLHRHRPPAGQDRERRHAVLPPPGGDGQAHRRRGGAPRHQGVSGRAAGSSGGGCRHPHRPVVPGCRQKQKLCGQADAKGRPGGLAGICDAGQHRGADAGACPAPHRPYPPDPRAVLLPGPAAAGGYPLRQQGPLHHGAVVVPNGLHPPRHRQGGGRDLPPRRMHGRGRCSL